MNPKVVKLREEREKNAAKIALLQERNKKIDADIIKIENSEILGMTHEFGLSPDMLYELILASKKNPMPANIICLMLAVLCMASFSVTAFAYEGGETATVTDAETAADPKEDIEIPYNCIIDEDGNLVITIGGVTDPAELETVGTVVTGGSCLNVRTGAGMDYEIIDRLSSGEEVKVIGSEGDWYEVIVPEKKGYVHGYYLELFEKAGQNSEIDLTMLMYLMGLMFGSLENAGSETIENGKPPFAFTPDGNLTLIDDFLQIEAPTTEDSARIEKQFITVQSKNENTFYIVIDRNGETENVYFLNLVDEADLMALM